MTRLATKVHKWLALLMAIQILFWFASGLFFAAVPIERVRSEHKIAEQRGATVPMGLAADGLLRLGSAGIAAEKVELRMIDGRPTALLADSDKRPQLYDLRTGEPLSPLNAAAAVRIAEADHDGPLKAAAVEPVTEKSAEYKGSLPAWRIRFDDGAGRALYVAADSGQVTARRSTLWRVYDTLWGLHIMDWRDHEDFNSLLLILATTLGLVTVVSGIIMLPRRLGLKNWRRRRRKTDHRLQGATGDQ